MNHIKSILIITFIISILGFVVWYIMWMNDLRGKYNVDQLSDNLKQTKKLKDEYIKDHKKKYQNNSHVDEEEPIIVQESQLRKKHSGKTLRERGYPENAGVELHTQLPQEATKPLLVEESEKSTDHFNDEDLDVEKKNHEAKPDLNKTMSITQKNNTISIDLKNENRPMTQKNTAPQKPLKALNEKDGGNTQHPTSTIRQW